jgi:DNA-binding NtrC family response regulator
MISSRVLVHGAAELPRIPQHRLRAAGVALERSASREEFFARVAAHPPDVVLLAPPLPAGDLEETIGGLLQSEPGLPVVVLLSRADAPGAVRAIRAGALDVLFDDAEPEGIAAALRKAADRFMQRSLAVALAPYVRPAPGVDSIIGTSGAARRLRAQVAKIATSEAMTILIQGESGTGKDLVAKTIHTSSPRASRPFVPINCTAIPDALLESEFFGHERGAFTDARDRKPGLLELADGGTAFLDEVGELGLGLQAKLLRFLEERCFKRLGGTTDIAVDVRIIAATNLDLARAVKQERFRRDLFYRLRVIPITLPALRDRADDVPLLADHFLQHHCQKFRKKFEGFHPDAVKRLQEHPWSGNIRELKNVIERVVLLEEGPLVLPEMLWLTEPAPSAAPVGDSGSPVPEECNLARLELGALMRALEIAGGNQSEAARLLGVSRDTVRARIKKHGIQVETRVRQGVSPAAVA